jgi:uncharacterized protein YwgA
MGDESKFKLLAAFRYLNQKIDMRDFRSRLIFQKETYLLQEMGLCLGNTYGWYLYGPYSRDVASDGFQLVSIQDSIDVSTSLSKADKEHVGNLKELIIESQETFSKNDEEYCLELLASLHFVLKHGYPRPTSENNALKQFLALKPKFGNDAKRALKLLKEHNLSPL